MRHRLLAGISFAALLACGPSASAATTTFLFTGAVQTFTAPTTGTYQILAFGAQGGSSGATGAAGGGGTEISGDFSLPRAKRWAFSSAALGALQSKAAAAAAEAL
jgi:hypothetical protein